MSYTFTVTQGDLLQEEGTTFIVNASNTRLILGIGVSMAFKEHCGNVLQQEMLESSWGDEKAYSVRDGFAGSI